jgi:hypothetical protein
VKSAGRLLPILSADLPSTPIPNALLVLFFGDHGAGANSPQDSGSVRADQPARWARLDHDRSVSLLRDALMCPPGTGRLGASKANHPAFEAVLHLHHRSFLTAVHIGVARSAKRNPVRLAVISGVATKFFVVDLKV